jgi:hypothetical protein
VDKLISSLEPGSLTRAVLLASAALGMGGALPEWIAELTAHNAEQAFELYQEGLITPEEQWALRFASALDGPDAQKGTEEVVLASLVEARSAACIFAEDIASRCSGPPRDDAAVKRRAGTLAKFIAGIGEKDLPTWRSLRMLVRHCRALADIGGAAEVSEAVGALERLWGPAVSWVREDSLGSDVASTVEILSCAAGRSLDAAHVDNKHPNMDTSVRARLCAGLARDGHPEEVRPILTHLVTEPLDPADVALLVPAALAVDPPASERIRGILESEIDAMPETSEAAATWIASWTS